MQETCSNCRNFYKQDMYLPHRGWWFIKWGHCCVDLGSCQCIWLHVSTETVVVHLQISGFTRMVPLTKFFVQSLSESSSVKNQVAFKDFGNCGFVNRSTLVDKTGSCMKSWHMVCAPSTYLICKMIITELVGIWLVLSIGFLLICISYMIV